MNNNIIVRVEISSESIEQEIANKHFVCAINSNLNDEKCSENLNCVP